MSEKTKSRAPRRPGAGTAGRRGADRGPEARGAGLTRAPAEGLAARQAAAALLAAVIDNRQSLDVISAAPTGPLARFGLDARDAALANAIAVSALRHRGTLSALIASMVERPLPDTPRSLHHILHAGLAQIVLLRVPEAAAVHLAVEAARADAQAKRFAPLVNALLRRALRDGPDAVTRAQAAAVNAPGWLVDALAADHGAGNARAMLAAGGAEPAIDLTVRADAAAWAERLGGRLLPTGTVRVPRDGVPLPEWPGFAEGAWWVQDAAAALPARLLGDVAGLDVADICAAPGGKTAQLAAAGARVTALDISAPRLKRLEANLARLGLSAVTIAGDARAHRPAAPHDAVLLDVPCSATGTLRRHPDAAWTKTADDITRLAAIQRGLLDAAFAMVRPGGRVVYANCSLLKAEGEDLVAGWLATRDDAEIEPVTPATDGDALAAFATAGGGLRTSPLDLPDPDPAMAGMDGFFAIRLRKRR